MTASLAVPASAEAPTTWRWNHSFAALGDHHYTRLQPTPLPAPYRVAVSRGTEQALALPAGWLDSDEALQVLAGNALLPGMEPLASVYSGHQFGVWAGQLGDGRAILLGETEAGLEIQLKGSGRTPYSRMGDGRAVLRSSIREFLCSEAMHALGIPTTRALSIVGSDAPVYREGAETAAVVARVAPSFIRFGHFEHFAARNDLAALRRLADHVIDRHYPGCRQPEGLGGNPYAALLREVVARTAELLAAWQAVGFCHGVMNTDNMSILGLTIDYGPFQFLDAYDPGHICNHSDQQGRYAYHRQPNIAYWNLFCLGQALMPLIEDQELALAALEPYKALYPAAFQARMRAKLGWSEPQVGDEERIDATLRLLAEQRVDYTIFWRRLAVAVQQTAFEPVRDLFPDRPAFDAWLLSFQERSESTPRWLAADLMLKANPVYVLRNHLGEIAIEQARQKDYSGVQTLLQVLERPFDDQPGQAALADFPPDWAASIAISCSS